MDVELKSLLVVFHSASGNTQAMTDAVVAGIEAAETLRLNFDVKHALEATEDDVLKANGVILLTPENFGYMSGALKFFFDRIYYPCLDHTQGLPYALVVRAGNDGEGAIGSIERIITGLAWQAVSPPVLSKGNFDASILEQCTELGSAFALGLDSGIF